MSVTASSGTAVFGHRVRDARRRLGLTLAELGTRVGRPAPYLSQLENGKVEPKLNLVNDLAGALRVTAAELLDPAPPSRRAELELEFARLQSVPSYRSLGLAELKTSSKVSDEMLEHLVALGRQLPTDTTNAGEANVRRLRAADRARLANIDLRSEMRERGNYYPEIERVAEESLAAVGYPGSGPVSERVMTDLAAHFGFTVERVQGMPRTARSITDQRSRVIYIPQRNDLRTRAARSVVLQTLGHFALAHQRTESFGDYVRQRVESNYFAAAVLAPERAAVDFLRDAKAQGDMSIEDLREVFYISYEMAAHRFTNLATHHLGIPVHFLRTDPEGMITKGYENDGIPFPTDADGGLEGQRVSRQWGTRQAWKSSDSYSLHYQYTRTDGGEYWCVTYLDTDWPQCAITVGTTAEHARHFRGHNTIRRMSARTEDTQPDPDLVTRWEGVAWPSAAERSYVLSALPVSERAFTPFPGVDLYDVYRFLDRRAGRG
jgi:predicted transcriptional regulator/transcriptional regulator with XRE-family HTH domain